MRTHPAARAALLALLLAAVAAGTARAQSSYQFETSIGRPPTVGEAQGIAVDKAGNIYVADPINGHVLEVTAAGRLVTNAWPGGPALQRPSAVAVGRAGNLVVVDEGLGSVNRLVKGAAKGAAAKTFKLPGVQAGGFNSLPGVAVDASGSIYVTDEVNNRVQKFDAQGKPLASWGKSGNEPGAFQGPRGVTVDAQGAVYVADEFNNRIQKFDGSGRFLGASSAESLGATISGGLGPMDVAADSRGNLWVAAHTNFAVYKLDPQFHIVARLETFGRRDGELAGPVSVAVDAKDNVYVLDRSRRIQQFSPTGSFLKKFEFPPAGPGEFSAPTGVLVDSSGNLYVSDTANFRIQKFDRSGRHLLSFGHFGQGPGEFNGAESIAMDGSGNLFVVDSYNHRVQKFDSSGNFLTSFGKFGHGPGEFARTKVVAVASVAPAVAARAGAGVEESVYVNDWHNNRVQKFDVNGKFIAEFGNTGPRETQVLGPTGLAVDRQGNVYVSSWYNNRVQKFDAQGKFLLSIGSRGSGDGELKGPARLAIDRNDNLVVADWGNSRIEVFNGEGRFLEKLGSIGSGNGQFNQPVGVALDGAGALFVSDASNARVQKFKKVGTAAQEPATASPPAPASGKVFLHVAIYDVKAGTAQDFEAVLLSTREILRGEPSFINERVLRNVDPLTLQYATYAKFGERQAADSSYAARLAKLRAYCRRDPEAHLTAIQHSYSAAAISDSPTGLDFGVGLVGQIAHLGLFIPMPHYRQQYEDVLHETKVLTRAKQPAGYVGEDVAVEIGDLPPEVQVPYTPRPSEPSRMSINYGEYRTMENAEDSYISRQQLHDPKLVAMERIFFSSLQVPTRFYIFQVIDNYGRSPAGRVERVAGRLPER